MGEIPAAEATQAYWVLYHMTPAWLVGEDSKDVAARRKLKDTSTAAERYPNDYAGRIQSLIPATEPRPGSAADLVGAVVLDLDALQVQACWNRAVKVVAGVLQPTTFEDVYGAIAPKVEEEFGQVAALSLSSGVTAHDETNIKVIRRINTLEKALSKTITHTGTGLYAVKGTPVNESETQSGAVAGQVVTIVGTVAASPAFAGGYISNTTQAEVRAIVSHTTNTATMEGDISGWGDGDTLEFYDSWSTINAAVAQLFVDQGTDEYTVEQIIDIYTGTYTEAVDIPSSRPAHLYRLRVKAASGQTVTVTNTALGAPTFQCNATESVSFENMSINSVVAGNYAINHAQEGAEIHNIDFDGSSGDGHGITASTMYAYECTFTDMNRATAIMDGIFNKCTFDNCLHGLYTSDGQRGRIISSCNFFDCGDCIRDMPGQNEPGTWLISTIIVNCTFYNSDSVYYCHPGAENRASSFRMYNCIVHTAVLAFDLSLDDTVLALVESDYNTIYNATNVANVAGTTYNLAGWQALTDWRGDSPDANSIDTDPGLTTPGSDISLTAASTSRHAGVGSFPIAPEGINDVAFDKWHPDKGAWSSGPGPNVVA